MRTSITMPPSRFHPQSWPSDLGLWRRALDLGEPLTFTRKSQLFTQSHVNDHALLMDSGIAKLCVHDADGHEVSICSVSSGSLLYNNLDNLPSEYSMSCVALTKCRAYRINKAHLLHEIGKNGQLALAAFHNWE